jgi:membrane protein involved in colicin uptake
MNFQDKLAGDMDDPVMKEALKNFKASVDAWSEAAYHQPRTVVKAPQHSWRLAASWALGCVLAAGGLSAGMYSRHHQQEMAKIAAARAAQKSAQERAAAERQAAAAKEAQTERAATEDSTAVARNSNTNTDDADDVLLATVASDVSRQVPSAMEPLAQLMDDGGSADNGSN